MHYFWSRTGDAQVQAAGTDGVDEAVEVVGQEDHPTVVHVLFHGPAQSSLGLASEFVGFVDDEHFEGAGLGFDVGVAGYFLDDMLDDVPVLVFVVGGSHFYVVVGGEDAEFDCGGGAFGLEDPIFFFEFEDVVSEDLGQEGVGPGLLAGSFGSVEDEVLGRDCSTGKSLVSASCRRTSVVSGW